ncbi:MAG: family peptidase, partial [Nevskia sp.]|nr:family peptidase [Nevskia sp.]
MKKLLLAAACACSVSACGKPPAPEPQTAPPLVSGIETQYFDDKVTPREDFYRYVNGKWLDNTDIPADENTWDANEELQVRVQQQLKALIEDLRTKPDAGDPDQRKIAGLYASFMDEAALERSGLKPLKSELARIDAINSRSDIAAEMGHLALIGVHTPLVPDLAVDTGNATAYAAYLYPGGFGLPDRDYYIEADARLAHIRQAYAGYVQALLTLSGDKAAVPDAAAVLKLETSLARVLWTQAQYRDPVKTYNKVPVAKLGNLAPDFDWSGYLSAAGLAGKTDAVVVIQPDYVQAFNQALRRTPLPVWRAYFRTRLLGNYAPYLDRRFADADFAFNGTVLTGTPTRQPRWQRGVELVNQSIGEGLGRQYVTRYFPPASKARIEGLVHSIAAAYA